MKIIRTTEIFNDMGVKVNIGDMVSIETSKGHYEGIVQSIKPNLLGLYTKDYNYYLAIKYENILKFK